MGEIAGVFFGAAELGEEEAAAIFAFWAGVRRAALARHWVKPVLSLKVCFVNIAGDGIAYRFGGEGQRSAPKLFRPGVYRFRLLRFHAVPAFGVRTTGRIVSHERPGCLAPQHAHKWGPLARPHR